MEKNNIFKAMNAIMNDIKPIAKNSKNTQQNYNFRGIDDAMNALSPIMTKHGVFPTFQSAEDLHRSELTSRSGSQGYRTVVRYTIRFYATDGSYVDVISDGEAIDYGDKGSNKAMSVAYREAIFKTFIIPFGNDDVENHDHDIKTVETEQMITTDQTILIGEMLVKLDKDMGWLENQIKDHLANKTAKEAKAVIEQLEPLIEKQEVTPKK